MRFINRPNIFKVLEIDASGTANAVRDGTENPACASNQLALHVYTRT